MDDTAPPVPRRKPRTRRTEPSSAKGISTPPAASGAATPLPAPAPSPTVDGSSSNEDAVLELLLSKAVVAINTLEEVMTDREASPSARVSAANALLGRVRAFQNKESAEVNAPSVEFIIHE